MISYKPFLKLLIDRELKKKDIIETGILSKATINKMNSNKYVSLEIIDKLCKYLSCEIKDIVEYISDENNSTNP